MSRAFPWPALVLAAGLGTRLAPLTSGRAKPSLPVAGRPLIARILDHLQQVGIRRVVINLHAHADSITAIVGDGRAWNLDVRYSWEPVILGSGGGPARALPLLAHDRFFILNGDTLSSVDLASLAAAHVQSGAGATLVATDADITRYNALGGADDGALTSRVPRGTTPAPGQQLWHFIGVQAVNASMFARVPTDRPSDILADIYLPWAQRQPGLVRILPTRTSFHDIGTPEDYLSTCLALAGPDRTHQLRGVGCRIHPTATLTDSVVWDRVHIGPGARMSHCIVTDGVSVPAGMRYHRQVLTPDGVVPF
jgi:NDP-sugar pyrophosphorylase family protein